jgi:4'-phosphopantetheinyl transferase
MIRWLVQTAPDCPDAARGEAPPGLLSPAEAAHLARLTYPKRRQEWLLGRWTAKRLLAAYLDEQGSAPPFAQITVGNDPTGAPYALIESGRAAGRIPVSLTISHSRGVAFCALAAQAGTATRLPRVGGDIELIEPREPSFVRDYFAPDEQAAVTAAPSVWRDGMATVIWSVKEAALKALQLGLSVDPRLATVCGRDMAERRTADQSGWSFVRIELHGELAASAAEQAGPGYCLSAWQRLYRADADDACYALTLCALARTEVRRDRVSV